MTRHCTNHCVACGTHFSSTSAFDAHRRGDMDSRYCVDVLDDARFAPVDERGECGLHGCGHSHKPVTVWTLGAALEAARARWAA